VTTAEKLYAFIVMIAAKVFGAFFLAEATSLTTELNAQYTSHIAKIRDFKQWMQHLKLSPELQARALKYYEILWDRL
jgi:hypothetical protein